MFTFQKNTFRLVLLFFSLLVHHFTTAQVVYDNNLDEITSDLCTGSSKKLIVSVVNGTCAPFEGNINAVAFTWQIESSPGVWQNTAAFPISGITYSLEQRINGRGTVISSLLSVNAAYGTSEANYNYRVLAQGSGGCGIATSLNEAIAVKKNSWLGTVSSSWNDPANWSCNRVPSSISTAVILPAINKPIITGNAIAKEVIMRPGSFLTVNSGHNLTVAGPITVQGDGNLTLQNNANLLQGSYNGSNNGTIHVVRNSSALMRQDYTLWSSPVAGQNLLNFSPQTLTNRFFEYNTGTNTYSVVNPSAASFQSGKGYLIRLPNNHPATPTVWQGQFTGVPNNGDIALSLVNNGAGFRFNAIGNPYPSPVKMSTFVNANSSRITGTLYFWRKTNNAATEPGYCTWTLAGFVSNGEAQVVNPNGILRTGQGFLVELVNNQTSVLFKNTMRVNNTTDQFFRTNSDSGELVGDKFRLTISNEVGAKSQMLLGYFNEATDGVDYAIDGKAIETTPLFLSTLLAGEKYVIEGKAPFQNQDVVPLCFSTETNGQFNISIESLEGVFSGNQDIFLKDNSTNVLHNLKTGSYTFTSDVGEFLSRFEVQYRDSALGNSDQTFNNNNVLVYKNNTGIVVKSNKEAIVGIQIFDIQGRLLKEQKNNNVMVAEIPMMINNQVLLIHVFTENGAVLKKKLML